MKYFIFIPHMNIGGVERSFLTLSNQLLEKGNNVSIITLNQSKNLLNSALSLLYLLDLFFPYILSPIKGKLIEFM